MKYLKNTFLVLILCSSFSSCSPLLSKKIVGTWKMEQVLDLGNDVSSEHNPNQDRWVTFYKDHTFKSGGGPFGENTGKWELDENTATLYLDSDAGEDDDSYWVVHINTNDMEWKGTKFDFAKRFTLRHIRVKS